jgi:hypothetical protein
MNPRSGAKLAAVNLGILVLGILPLWFAIAWATAALTASSEGQQLSDVLDAFLMGYLSLVLPLLVAGLIQQFAFMLGLARVRRLPPRGFALATAAAIPILLHPISAPLDVQFAPPFVLATVGSVLAFGLLMRIPRRELRD